MTAEVVVVGAGPSGLEAARKQAAMGKRVLVIDENLGPGGQIWRGMAPVEIAGVDFLFGRRVVDLGERVVYLEDGEVAFERLILACGARELFLPFPGWTLPHVVGAGGLQALVKMGLDVRGKTVVVAGSGPLLWAVAANLRKAGAIVPLVAEQAGWAAMARFAFGLWRWPDKVGQAIGLHEWRFRPGLWPVEAVADGVKMSDGKLHRCDYLACGFGLVPNDELMRLIVGDRVEAVGEMTGITGGNFTLRPELRTLAREDTIVCRCEDVSRGALRGWSKARDAKLQTRCGMGPCQGRVCGPAVDFIMGWREDRVRPPIYPVKAKDLCRRS